MTRMPRSVRALATALAGLAGFVDAVGFLAAGGLFVSFMSGNSTRLAVDGLDGGTRALAAAALIALFVAGAALGSATAHAAGRRQRAGVLALVTLLLVAAGALTLVGQTAATLGLVALAMGAENSVLERDGQPGPGLTYVTGALVRVGQGCATWARTGTRPPGTGSSALLWLGLMVGAVLGALAYQRLGLSSVWIAAAVSALLTAVACLPAVRHS